MAYLINTKNFECNKYLAIWKNGINEPNYNKQLKSWQFVFTNGELCNGFECVFIVNWNCDQHAINPQINANERGQCIYQITINSTLACD